MNKFYVYIMTNLSNTLYVGITNNLERRIYEHKHELLPGFTNRYKIHRLIYFEEFCDVYSAIQREKQIKGWVRRKKIVLIDSINPQWIDLTQDWFED